MSIVASIAVLTISAIRTKAIATQERDQLEAS